MTIDANSGKEIRRTDNGLKECDFEAPQDARPLTKEQIADIIKMVGGNNGNA